MNVPLEQFLNYSSRELDPFFDKAFKLSRRHFSDVIYFSMPGMVHFDTPFYQATDPLRFPAISITGTSCHLSCEHCKGKLLETMIPATTPQRLLDVCTKIKLNGGTGCLISGGSLKDGSVPLTSFIPYIRRVKHELGLDVVVHTGVLSPKLAEELAQADIDAAMIDIIGSNETIRSVYHLDLTVDAFDYSLSLLEKNHIPIVPHIVVGIHYGRLKGEGEALQIVSKHHPAAVIIVALTPLELTSMENLTPSSPMDIARVILASRFMMVDTPILLGCARPWGEHKSQTDILAIKAGVNGIAYPSEEGHDYAKKIGLQVRFSEACCALMYRDLQSHRGEHPGDIR
jgi:uncharacterized radical SAM superfamily protein